MVKKQAGRKKKAKVEPTTDPPTDDPSKMSSTEHDFDELDAAIEGVSPEPEHEPEGAESTDVPVGDSPADVLEQTVDAIAEHPELVAELAPEDVADLLGLAFDLVAERRGPHWRLEDKEKERIARQLQKSALVHGMDWLGKYLPDVLAVALLAYAVLQRVQVDRDLARPIPAEPATVGVPVE